MRILFAPDYRTGNPYQSLLADALCRLGVEVTFLRDYYNYFPLFRGSRTKNPDILHIHWPEEYFPRRKDYWNLIRVARYPADLWLTMRNYRVVVTAHNLFPHNRANEPGIYHDIRYTLRRAQAIFVHSNVARQQVCETFAISNNHIHTIPLGDHSIPIREPMPRDQARKRLGLPLNAKICLVFGMVSPYKGTDELVRFWSKNHVPHRLIMIGFIDSKAFADRLNELAQGHDTIDLRLRNDWLDDATLRVWLSAADCSIFNYQSVLTSGAAALSRSYGLPLLIPRRLKSVDLDEPHPHVFRFNSLDTDFEMELVRALATPSDYNLAREWRRKTSWERVAELSASVYRNVLNLESQKKIKAEATR